MVDIYEIPMSTFISHCRDCISYDYVSILLNQNLAQDPSQYGASVTITNTAELPHKMKLTSQPKGIISTLLKMKYTAAYKCISFM